MLPLDDPRWLELNHRGWTRGQRFSLDPDAPFVPDELKELMAAPLDIERFSCLWPYLCSEGTTWAAAYAAVPYIVNLAKDLQPAARVEYLLFVGFTEIYSCPDSGDSFQIRPYLVESYRRALTIALPLLAETLICQHDAYTTLHLLAAVAALKGHVELGCVLDQLEIAAEECPQP